MSITVVLPAVSSRKIFPNALHNFLSRKSSAKALDVLNQNDKVNSEWYLETRRKALASSNSEQIDRLSKEWETSDKHNK